MAVKCIATDIISGLSDEATVTIYDTTDGATGPGGETGDAGPLGPQGDPGVTGDQGDSGDIGDQGEVGLQGDSGDQGESGSQGFQGEFEDFVKMKMASAQGGPEEFMTEDEMQIGPEELQSQIPMGQQVAQGGRIGYQNAGPVGGIMDVVAEEQVETGPTTQQLIMKWLNDRGLPITPENIQRAILEMSREGQGPTMPREQMYSPQMEQPRVPTGEGYVPETKLESESLCSG